MWRGKWEGGRSLLRQLSSSGELSLHCFLFAQSKSSLCFCRFFMWKDHRLGLSCWCLVVSQGYFNIRYLLREICEDKRDGQQQCYQSVKNAISSTLWEASIHCQRNGLLLLLRTASHSVTVKLHFDLMQCSHLKGKTSLQSLSFVKMNYKDPSSICTVEFCLFSSINIRLSKNQKCIFDFWNSYVNWFLVLHYFLMTANMMDSSRCLR